MHLSALEAKRTEKRQLAEDLQSMNQQTQQRMKDTEKEVHQVDDDITKIEKGLRKPQVLTHNSQNSVALSEHIVYPSASTQTQADEVLADPMIPSFTMTLGLKPRLSILTTTMMVTTATVVDLLLSAQIRRTRPTQNARD